MDHGKDFLVDKPGVLTREQLADVRPCRRRRSASTRSCTASDWKTPPPFRAADTRACRGDRQGDPDCGTGSASATSAGAARLVLGSRSRRGILSDNRFAPVRSVLVLHNVHQRQANLSARVSNVCPSGAAGVSGLGDAMVQGNGVRRLPWRGLVQPRGLPTLGATRVSRFWHRGLRRVRKNIDVAGRAGASHLIPSTVTARATSTAATCASIRSPARRRRVIARDGDVAGALLSRRRMGIEAQLLSS
jgi:hypothetical protein